MRELELVLCGFKNLTSAILWGIKRYILLRGDVVSHKSVYRRIYGER